MLDLPKLERVDGEQRYYLTPTGEKYPSVTTILSQTADKSHLIAWRKRVGEEEANRVSKRATTRGTSVHSLCEKLVLNEDIDLSKEMPTNVAMYNQLETFLKDNVNDIRLSEGQLFSHKLKCAGSVDLVASYRGRPAIIDFKTASKTKRKDWIEDYFLQTTLYAFSLWEMTGEHYPNIVVAIAVENDNQPQIFVDRADHWIDKARARCKAYHSKIKS